MLDWSNLIKPILSSNPTRPLAALVWDERQVPPIFKPLTHPVSVLDTDAGNNWNRGSLIKILTGDPNVMLLSPLLDNRSVFLFFF